MEVEQLVTCQLVSNLTDFFTSAFWEGGQMFPILPRVIAFAGRFVPDFWLAAAEDTAGLVAAAAAAVVGGDAVAAFGPGNFGSNILAASRKRIPFDAFGSPSLFDDYLWNKEHPRWTHLLVWLTRILVRTLFLLEENFVVRESLWLLSTFPSLSELLNEWIN